MFEIPHEYAVMLSVLAGGHLILRIRNLLRRNSSKHSNDSDDTNGTSFSVRVDTPTWRVHVEHESDTNSTDSDSDEPEN